MSDQQIDVPLSVLLEHLKWNLQRFKEMLDQEATPYFRDAALQRFEFTMSSVLKCIARATGKSESIEDLQLLDQAVKENWFPDKTNTADIINSLESLKPESRAEKADDIYEKLTGYYEVFETLHLKLQ